jgi:hypothetical protein
LATDESWVIWPQSLAPEVGFLRPAALGAGEIELDTGAIFCSVGWIVAEVSNDAWFDLYLSDGKLVLRWRSGGECAESASVAFSGTSEAHVQVHASDLRRLFPKQGSEGLTMALESRGNAVILTSTQTTEIDGLPATIRCSIVARRETRDARRATQAV